MGTVIGQLCDRYSCTGQDKETEETKNSGLMPVQRYARGKMCMVGHVNTIQSEGPHAY